MKIVSTATMRDLDARTIAAGTPGAVLMERAGAGACVEMLRFLERRVHPWQRSRITVLAGKGNNGGDAYVLARHLHERLGQPPIVYAVCAPATLTGDAAAQARRLPAAVSVVVCDRLPAEATRPGTVIVDGLLGTGTTGVPRPPFDRFIAQVNAATGCAVVALDIPSGLDGDSGRATGAAVVADLTVTMGQPKAGLLTADGLAHAGALRCIDIGIPAAFVEAAPGGGEAIFERDVAPLLGRRPHDSHKGRFGHVLVVGGSSDYAGAPVLAGGAALRMGCGLATVAVPAAARALLPVPLGALIVRALADDDGGFFTDATVPGLRDLLRLADAVLFGPGIGQAGRPEAVLEALAETEVPLVLDADGLRVLATRPQTLKNRRAATVLTPHPGEMRALLAGFGLNGYSDAGRSEQARALAAAVPAFVVLKGMGSVLARPDGGVAINTSGTSGLATAGTGDVLAGALASLLAQGLSPWDAMRLGVFVHGRAAETAVGSWRALVADDLPELFGPALAEIAALA